MTDAFIITVEGMVAAAAYVVVGCGAGLAVFSPKINDTTLERFCLSAISISAFASTFRIIKAGYISEGGMVMAVAFAGYVIAIIAKYMSKTPTKKPFDKTKPGELL